MSRPSRKERVMKWIPCSERLPEENGHYLVTARWQGELIVASDDYFSYGWDDWDDVIAWMPLPKPYEAEQTEPKREADA